LHFRELFEIFGERARDVIERAIRLTCACQIYMCNAIGKGKFAITGETIKHQC